MAPLGGQDGFCLDAVRGGRRYRLGTSSAMPLGKVVPDHTRGYSARGAGRRPRTSSSGHQSSHPGTWRRNDHAVRGRVCLSRGCRGLLGCLFSSRACSFQHGLRRTRREDTEDIRDVERGASIRTWLGLCDAHSLLDAKPVVPERPRWLRRDPVELNADRKADITNSRRTPHNLGKHWVPKQPYPNKISPVAAADVAQVVAAVLADPGPHLGRIYELTGPRSQEMHGVDREYSRAGSRGHVL
jgi:hypothetical protein